MWVCVCLNVSVHVSEGTYVSVCACESVSECVSVYSRATFCPSHFQGPYGVMAVLF